MINYSIDMYGSGGKDWYESLNWEEFKKFWPLAQEEKPENYWGLQSGPCRLKEEEVTGLVSIGVKLTVEPLPGAMIVKMQDRHKWEYNTKVSPDLINSGAAVHIAVPDMPLMMVNDVEVLEDCCTNVLQGYLDEGWRIIAVCPPNAQRRPDYIVGRTKGKQ